MIRHALLQKSTKVLRNPSILEGSPMDGTTLDQVESLQTLVTRLQVDIIEAAKVDTMYSPQSDIVRHVHGG